MIRFSSPGFLLILPLLFLLFLIVRMSRRRKDISVSSLFIWKKLIAEKQAPLHIHRYRRNLFLLLPFLALSLAFLALAGPVFITSVPAGGRRIVYILDTSASMQSRLGSASRFTSARESALESMASLDTGDRAALLRLDSRPDIISLFTDDQARLRRLVSEMEASDEIGDIAAALKLAANITGDKIGSKVYIFTDKLIDSATEQAYPFEISWNITADSRANAGITNFTLRQNPGTEDEYSLMIEIFATSDWQGSVLLGIESAGAQVLFENLELSPGLTSRSFHSLSASPGSALTARLMPADGTNLPLDALESDNTAYALVPVYPRPRVLCITGGNFFLERALAVQQDFDIYVSSSPLVRGRFDVLITDGVTAEVPYPVAGRIRLAARGELSDLSEVPQDADVFGKTPVPVVDWRRLHPILKGVDLSGISVQPVQPDYALPSSSVKKIVSTAEEDVITAVENGSRLLFFDFLLAESTLPYSPAFPLLIANAIWWSYCGMVPSKQDSYRTGEEIVLPASLPDGVYSFTSQQGYTVEGTVENHRLLIDHPSHSGLFFLDSGRNPAAFAVNLFSRDESDIHTQGPVVGGEMSAHKRREPDEMAPARNSIPLGPIVLILMLAVLCADWFAYRARPAR